MKLIVAGGRNFDNYNLLCNYTEEFIVGYENDVEIVSGGANGADLLGEKFAKEKGYPIKRFDAQWVLHGKSAGAIRNREMAKYATDCICFWDGKSRGTKMMIDFAKEQGLPVLVVKY